MACPYFFPEAEVDFSARPRPARAPLGTIFNGLCYARPEAPSTPPEGLLYEQCNFGYGRGSCPMFPASGDVDAVRFTKWQGRLIYILEKNYSPAGHGDCSGELKSPVLARQAAVFAQQNA